MKRYMKLTVVLALIMLLAVSALAVLAQPGIRAGELNISLTGATTQTRTTGDTSVQVGERAANSNSAAQIPTAQQTQTSALPVLDARDPDDLLGYDEHGIPR